MNLFKSVLENTDIDINDPRLQKAEQIHSILFDIFKETMNNKKGAFYNSGHKVTINEQNMPAYFVVALHESVHAAIGCTLFGIYSRFIEKLLDLLISYESTYKANFLMNFLPKMGIKNTIDKLSYLHTHKYELDIILSQKKEFVYFLEACERVFNFIETLRSNSIIMNEGVASYISLNLSSKFLHTIYSTLVGAIYNIDVKLGEAFEGEFKEYQMKEIEKIKSLTTDSPYFLGYKMAEHIVNKYGENGLLISILYATYIPFFNHPDIFDKLDVNFKRLFHTTYCCDYRWSTFLFLDEQFIRSIEKSSCERMSEITKKLYGINEPQHVLFMDGNIDIVFLNRVMLNSQLLKYIKYLGADYLAVHFHHVDEIKKSEGYLSKKEYVLSDFQELLVYNFIGVMKGEEFKFSEEELLSKFQRDKAIETLYSILRCAKFLKDDKRLNSIVNDDRTLIKEEIDYIKQVNISLHGSITGIRKEW